MLDSKKELVALEAHLSNAATKRSPFHLLSSIFSKKKASILEKKPSETASEYSMVKRKNDLETLHLSRQDNPYLKQLSLPEETLLSLAENALFQSEWLLGEDKELDIHQHLVRSPPPQFPQHVTHFMYNSPKRQINQVTNENHCKKAKSLNPIQPKKEIAVLDPGIREVLEYQKSQLIAGIQHSLSIGQAQFGTLDGTSAASLPGLTTCYLDLDRKTSLGPIRIGRTLSDSICHDNKRWSGKH